VGGVEVCARCDRWASKNNPAPSRQLNKAAPKTRVVVAKALVVQVVVDAYPYTGALAFDR
jgi:hypothetical protein